MNLLQKGMVLDIGSDRLVLQDRIGFGAQGQVWKVQEKNGRGRIIAAKLVAAEFDKKKSADYTKKSDLIKHEIGLMQEFDHRFLSDYNYTINCFIEQENGNPTLIATGFTMRYEPIGALTNFLARKGFVEQEQLELSEKIQILRRVWDGISALHQVGIIHSDLKPDNILLCREGSEYIPKIIDFGSSFRVQEPDPGNRTKLYAAPELAPQGSTATYSSDVYALGLVSAQVLAGSSDFFPSSGKEIEINSQLWGDDSITLIVQRTLSEATETRPTASRVADVLKYSKIAGNGTVTGTNNKSKFPKGRFLWHSWVQRQMFASRIFIFVKVARPTADSRRLRSILENNGLTGFSLRRTFGEFDAIVCLWLDYQKNKSLIQQIIRDFTTSGQGLDASFQISECEAFDYLPDLSTHSSRTTDLPSCEQIIKKVEDYIDADNNSSEQMLSDLIYKNVERSSKQNWYHLAINIVGLDQNKKATTIQKIIAEYLMFHTKNLTKSQQQITRISVDIHTPKIHIEIPCSSIQKYRDILLGISKYLREHSLNDTVHFKYNTFIDIDGDCFEDQNTIAFSDDGYLIDMI